MPRVMPHVDVVIVGIGWTGSIVARELADTSPRIVGLERGRFRDAIPDFSAPNALDEIKWNSRGEMFQDLSRETLTFRNKRDETALPMRRLGAFLLGDGLGGFPHPADAWDVGLRCTSETADVVAKKLGRDAATALDPADRKFARRIRACFHPSVDGIALGQAWHRCSCGPESRKSTCAHFLSLSSCFGWNSPWHRRHRQLRTRQPPRLARR